MSGERGWLRLRMVRAIDDRPLLMIAIGVLLFSSGPVLVAASSVSGSVLSFWRLWIGAAVLGLLTVWRGRSGGAGWSGSGWRWTAAAGTAFGIHQLFFMIAIKETSVVDVTLMQTLQPILVGVLALVIFGERPGATFRLWSMVAVVGAAVVVLAGTSGPQGDPVGMALAIANVVFYALYFVSSKQAMVHIAAVPFLFGVAVVAALPVSLFVAVTGERPLAIGATDLVIAALIALVPGGLGLFVSTHPLSRVPANIPPVMQLGMPFIAGAFAWLLLGQGISALHLLGGLITIIGVVGSLVSPSGRRLARSSRAVVQPEGRP
jgi:drug/metabolite transporter (DMT)-like permease